jgi:hypothetical protein
VIESPGFRALLDEGLHVHDERVDIGNERVHVDVQRRHSVIGFLSIVIQFTEKAAFLPGHVTVEDEELSELATHCPVRSWIHLSGVEGCL